MEHGRADGGRRGPAHQPATRDFTPSCVLPGERTPTSVAKLSSPSERVLITCVDRGEAAGSRPFTVL